MPLKASQNRATVQGLLVRPKESPTGTSNGLRFENLRKSGGAIPPRGSKNETICHSNLNYSARHQSQQSRWRIPKGNMIRQSMTQTLFITSTKSRMMAKGNGWIVTRLSSVWNMRWRYSIAIGSTRVRSTWATGKKHSKPSRWANQCARWHWNLTGICISVRASLANQSLKERTPASLTMNLGDLSNSSLLTSKVKPIKSDKKWQKLSIMPRRIPLSELTVSMPSPSQTARSRLTFELSRQTGLRRTPSSARLSTNGAQEAKGQKKKNTNYTNWTNL